MIPKIDSQIGITVYTTQFPGCGGVIRLHEEDFQVNEVISKKAQDQIKENDGYAVYKLKKQKIDTNHALESIFKKTRVRLKALGLKDSSAITEQYLCATNKSKPLRNLSDHRFSLSLVGFTKKPLSKKDMVGNFFKIKISDPQRDITKFTEFDKILNFFGYQRFGSKRPVNHLIGKALIQKNFEKAVSLLISYTSEYDSKENTAIRKKIAESSNLSEIYDEIPNSMDIEKKAIRTLSETKNSLSAMRAIPINVRRLFVQAYQSYIFNKTLSQAFEFGENLFSSGEGDVCFDKNGILGKYVKDPAQKLAIPLVGYSYYKKTRFDYHISKILKTEEIEPKNFYIKEIQELSSEGGFRNAAITCSDFDVSGNTVSFKLSRGSFATTALREMMKPDDPVNAGF